MTWFMAGAAAVSAGTAALSGIQARNSAIKSANSASKAEGEAIVKERLNKTISNSYSTAFAQMQLALSKRQLSQQRANIGAASLAARGDAAAANAATGSIGATTEHVVSDIEAKSQAAVQSTEDAFESAVINYNNELEMLALNTDQTAPNVRENVYTGPSTGAIIGGALISGLGQFASNYAMRSMSLGLGSAAPNVPSSAGSSIYALPSRGVRLGG